MKYPYLLISDSHFHRWDTYSGPCDAQGLNSRLYAQLKETIRAVQVLVENGGDTVIHAGDMFHTRGSLAPSVINPVRDMWSEVSEDLDCQIFAIAGNHDLESNDTRWLTAATAAMPVAFDSGLYHRQGNTVLVNWVHDVPTLKKVILQAKDDTTDYCNTDLIIHAPVDGVITGIPDHGLTADWLQSLGFNRVFAGHYHNHKQFPGTNVFSIGAQSHQTWSDVGSRAGFMLVWEDRVQHFASNLPKFVRLPLGALDSMDEESLMNEVDGNYIQIALEEATVAEEARVRVRLGELGAKGISIRAAKVAAASVTSRTVTAGELESIPLIVAKFAEAKGGKALATLCDNILRGAV